MNDQELKAYCLEQARYVAGNGTEVLNVAKEFYAWLKATDKVNDAS